nr:PREDICTED: uncharacterized protein LOC108194998 [Daucus carota subsp. sativus]
MEVLRDVKLIQIVPHAEKRFRLHVVAYDQTGKLDVIISDREVYEPHRFIGYRARDVIPEGALPAFFPNQLRQFTDKHSQSCCKFVMRTLRRMLNCTQQQTSACDSNGVTQWTQEKQKNKGHLPVLAQLKQQHRTIIFKALQKTT